MKQFKDELSDVATPVRLPTSKELGEASARIREWVQGASCDDFGLLLEALQITVNAEKGRGELTGVIPEYARAHNDSDVRSVVTKNGEFPFRIPLATPPGLHW